VRVFAKAGTGGQGSAKLGSVGGPGGDVVVETAAHLTSLNHIAATDCRFHAGPGSNGTHKMKAAKGAGKKEALFFSVSLSLFFHLFCCC
jgi:GTPase involved in cell partitioning and DNA repair